MLIAKGEWDNEDTLILGLSRGNIDGLLSGNPMVIGRGHPGRDGIAPFGNLIIVFGETEKEIEKKLREVCDFMI